jgi:hypothetical protein
MPVLDKIEYDAPKKGASDIQTIPVKGTVVSRYAKACDEMKQAEATMQELAGQLQEAGVAYVFKQNIQAHGQPMLMISSVNLVDKDSEAVPEGTVDRVQFSWSRKNLKNDPKQVKAVFESIRTIADEPVKTGDYVEDVVVCAFDTKVFLTKNDKGEAKFDEKKYLAFTKAIAEVAKDLKVPMPLTSSKKLVPKPDFHDRRFADFDFEANETLAGTLPTSVSLEVIRATQPETK